MRTKCLPIALALLGGTANAEDTFSCKGWTTRIGMHAMEVQARCDGPDLRETVRVPVRTRGAVVSKYNTQYAQIERWTYGRESDRFRTVLTFELATLKKIEIVRRGEAAPIL